MKQWKPVAVGVAALAVLAVSTARRGPNALGSRSARPLPAVGELVGAQTRFAPEESAALFVGVRKFTHGDTVDVPYAVDDAVDLAYLFTLAPQLRLVPPQRVVLALSGRPQKDESKRRLIELEQAGARVAAANQSDILALLQQQAALAGKGGIFIVSLATHGFIRDGEPYILGEGSMFQYPETAIRAARIFDIAATSDAARSLIFVDACRNRLTDKTRSGVSDPESVAPSIAMFERMTRTTGQVVFYAAAAGQYAFDDAHSQNGVFTRAVLDGLSCHASSTRGVVTVETLQTYVARQVRNWTRKNRPNTPAGMIQVSMDGAAKNMPLSCCRAPCVQAPPGGPIEASSDGTMVVARGAEGVRWRKEAGAAIEQVEVSDLDGDLREEVIVATARQLLILDRQGRRVAVIDEQMALETFVTGELLGKGRRQIVALWNSDRSSASRLALYDGSGRLISSYEHPGPLRQVLVDRPTAKHAWKLIVRGTDRRGAPSVFLFEPRKVLAGKPLWYGSIVPRGESIRSLEIGDFDADGRRDISVSTAGGGSFVVDFAGKLIGRRKGRNDAEEAQFTLLPRNVAP